ncbi:unnamed protein product [Rotaria sordida]|uniref:Uncharacterized protein n=1 Tax=Rotaria sordida TaxID=392033 RepID=A0A815W8M3_9BILA|nr:unnamed protein product [Rotaria sordida]CAF1540601.1 unnamed protein product [Rotaria sordida]
MATNQQLTTIKCLILDHFITFNELSSIISYTPDLRRLHFSHRHERDTTIGSMSSIALTNLTYLSLRIFSLNFHDFEIFIGKIHSKLITLSVNISSNDFTYLDAYRWERLILQHLSQLERFSFQYLDHVDNEHRYFEGLNQFCSPFWIKRQWIFDAKIVDEGIVYVVHPYKKRWYEYTDERMVNSSTDLCQCHRLILNITSCDEFNELMKIEIQRILTVVQLYHLEIHDIEMAVDKLLEIIDLFPNLISIKIDSLSLTQANVSCKKIVNISQSTKNTDKITMFYLDNITEMKEVYLLMKLCPHLTYLRIESLGGIDAELFVEEILKKINQECHDSLRWLCFF